jgi:PAS domain S-box-containing protein
MVLVLVRRSESAEGKVATVLETSGISIELDRLFAGEVSAQTFTHALDVIRAQLGCARLALGQLDEFGELVLLYFSGYDAAAIESLQHYGFASEDWTGAWGDALNKDDVCVNNHPTQDGHPAFRSERELAAPIRFDSAALGVLYAADKPTDFHVADGDLMALCARRLGPVLAYTLTEHRFRRQLDAAEEMATAAAEGERFFMMSRDLMAIADHKIRRTNAAFSSLLGLEVYELREKSLSDLTHPHDRDLLERELHQMRTEPNREHPPVAVNMLTKSGETRRVEWVGAATEEGRVYAVGRDITAISQAFEKLAAYNRELQRLREEAHAEEVLAARLLAHVQAQGCLDAPGIQYVTSSLGFFSGDAILAALTPSGELRWMLGDFTGHGLAAAIGTVPLAGAFYASCRDDQPFERAIASINDLLKSLLPPGLFCACALLSLNKQQDELSVWNCGLPTLLVRKAGDGSVHEHQSQCLPLGLLDSHELEIAPTRMAVERGDDVFVFSDGLTETLDASGQLFGLERAKGVLLAAAPGGGGFQSLMRAVADFQGLRRASDDLSLICVSVGHTHAAARTPGSHSAQGVAKSTESSQR